jgi:hypothetical protein
MIEAPDPLHASLVQDTNASGRKAYHTPALQRYGNVQELTLTTALFTSNFDGGGHFSQYLCLLRALVTRATYAGRG